VHGPVGIPESHIQIHSVDPGITPKLRDPLHDQPALLHLLLSRSGPARTVYGGGRLNPGRQAHAQGGRQCQGHSAAGCDAEDQEGGVFGGSRKGGQGTRYTEDDEFSDRRQ
jgi:hypothetical protein